MSCRVIGRTVEAAILALLVQEASEASAASLVADFLPTRKNSPAKDVYPQHGFQKLQDSPEYIRYQLKLANANLLLPDWFEVVDSLSET